MKRKRSVFTSPAPPTPAPHELRAIQGRPWGSGPRPPGAQKGRWGRNRAVPADTRPGLWPSRQHVPPLRAGPGRAEHRPRPAPRRRGTGRPPPAANVATAPGGRIPKARSARRRGRGERGGLAPAGLGAQTPIGGRGRVLGGGPRGRSAGLVLETERGSPSPSSPASRRRALGDPRGLAPNAARGRPGRDGGRPRHSPHPHHEQGHPAATSFAPAATSPASALVPATRCPYPPPPGAPRRCLPLGAHPYLAALRLALHPGAHPSPGRGALAGGLRRACAWASSRAPVRAPGLGRPPSAHLCERPAGCLASSRAPASARGSSGSCPRARERAAAPGSARPPTPRPGSALPHPAGVGGGPGTHPRPGGPAAPRSTPGRRGGAEREGARAHGRAHGRACRLGLERPGAAAGPVRRGAAVPRGLPLGAPAP